MIDPGRRALSQGVEPCIAAVVWQCGVGSGPARRGEEDDESSARTCRMSASPSAGTADGPVAFFGVAAKVSASAFSFAEGHARPSAVCFGGVASCGAGREKDGAVDGASLASQ